MHSSADCLARVTVWEQHGRMQSRMRSSTGAPPGGLGHACTHMHPAPGNPALLLGEGQCRMSQRCTPGRDPCSEAARDSTAVIGRSSEGRKPGNLSTDSAGGDEPRLVLPRMLRSQPLPLRSGATGGCGWGCAAAVAAAAARGAPAVARHKGEQQRARDRPAESGAQEQC